MIDLIIPHYNNPSGLQRTLDSINRDIFYVTVIDDCSDIYIPHIPIADQVFMQSTNKGPGRARQRGIEKTNNEYIMFLDAGDVFISKEIQKAIAHEVYLSEANLITFQYYHYDTLANFKDNRMHGKVYKRSFLYDYDITFAPESSYLDEDIGFNRTCNIIIEKKNLLQRRCDIPIIKQIKEKDSLTQKDNQAALYRDQTRALSLVSIHTIDTLIKNNIDPLEEINQIAVSLYYWFIRTTAERREFAQQAWAGARIFYTQFQNQIVPNNLFLGNAKIKQCLEYRDKISFPINILRFADEIIKNEIIPNKYLT